MSTARTITIGETVVVREPWWWKSRDGIQMKTNLPCVVTEVWKTTDAITVRDRDNPGAHGRMVRPEDLAE